ncbi:MAG: sigma-70 family RNA polymerase sigma factor [Planctomycetota bacterium]
MTADHAEARADLLLVRRVLRGDQSALLALSERLTCVARTLRVRNARSGGALDEHELADLCQDVLLIVWRKLDRYDGFAVLPAWAYSIAALEYQNALRKKRRRPQALELGEGASEGAGPEPGGRRDDDPWEFEDVYHGLDRIGRDEAAVIRLKHFQGRTFVEISSLLGIAESTAKDRYYRGIAELRPLLRDRRTGR